MSLETRIVDLATRIATEIKVVRGEIANAGGGDLLASNNLSDVANLAQARTNLDVPSKGDVTTQVQLAIAALVGDAPETLDTLSELADALGDAPDAINNILAALGLRIRVDAAQTFTAAQRAQGQANLNVVDAAAIGNTDRNFVTTFENGLV